MRGLDMLPGRRLLAILLLIAMALAVVPHAGAQIFVDSQENEVSLAPGETARFEISFTNPTDRPYFIAGKATGNLSDTTQLEPARFGVPAQGTNSTQASITLPEETEFTQGEVRFAFTVVDRTSGEAFQETTRVTVTAERPPLLLGIYENPLPPPADIGWGMFAAEIVSWILIAMALVSLLGVAIRRLVPGAEDMVQDEMVSRVKAPVFYLIFVLGLNYSWRLIPQTPTLHVMDSILDAIAVVVAAVLAYRSTGAGLFYYGQNWAGHTETKVDDVLVPVLEKLSAAVIIGMAAFYTFQVLGVDLSFLVAGGLVAGLVISMAAQDTLSNFFSGLYLLIDRPFRENDDIELETGEICRVDDVGMRSCRLYHYRNHQQIIVPNNDLATKRVINLSYPDKYYRIVIPVGVSYDTDLDEVRELLRRVAMDNDAVQKGRNTAPRVFVRAFGDSAIELELRVYVHEPSGRNPVRSDLIGEIKQAFDEAGIVIPFPQRVLWTGKSAPEAMKAGDLEVLGTEVPDEDDPEAPAGA